MKLVSAATGRVHVAALLAAGLLAIVASDASARVTRDTKSEVLGWVEHVTLYPGGLRFVAKLDTGARTSSVDVSEYELYSLGGRQWVRFRLSDRNGGSVGLERPVVRFARVRRSQAKTVRRPVIMLGLCMGAAYREIEVNLAKRNHLDYPMLVGRSGMRGIAVDPSRKFTADPVCRPPANSGAAP